MSQILSSLTLLMSSLGIKTGWRVVHGPPDFFSVTKKIHNALQGGDINLTDRKMQLKGNGKAAVSPDALSGTVP